MPLPDLLIADDDRLIRVMLKDALKDVPCQVREAESGDATLAELEKKVPDVMILDLIMPGKSGLELLKIIKERKLATRVLVISALDTEALVQQALRDGAQGFINKPFHPLEVEQVVRGAFEAAGGKAP
jgi:two-component system chemotaxis response regulator CheY